MQVLKLLGSLLMQQLLFDPCLYLVYLLSHTQLNVAVYKDRASVSAINSGGTAIPPSYINDVADNCFSTGISKSNETPPI